MKIAVMNQKGGATKTEVAKTLLVELAKNIKVTGVDADAQGNLTKFFKCYDGRSLIDVIRNDVKLADIMIHISPNFHLVRSAINLAALDIEISNTFGAETTLIETLEASSRNTDVTIFDCPPAINRLTASIIATVDYIIIPITPSSIDAIDGYEYLLTNIQDIVNVIKCRPKEIKVLISRYNEQHVADRDNLEKLKQMDVEMFQTFIRDSTAVSRARNEYKTIIQYDPKNKVALDYLQFIEELKQDLYLMGTIK